MPLATAPNQVATGQVPADPATTTTGQLPSGPNMGLLMELFGQVSNGSAIYIGRFLSNRNVDDVTKAWVIEALLTQSNRSESTTYYINRFLTEAFKGLRELGIDTIVWLAGIAAKKVLSREENKLALEVLDLGGPIGPIKGD